MWKSSKINQNMSASISESLNEHLKVKSPEIRFKMQHIRWVFLHISMGAPWLTVLSSPLITDKVALSGPHCKSAAPSSINASTQTQRLLLEVIRTAAWSDKRSSAWSVWICSSWENIQSGWNEETDKPACLPGRRKRRCLFMPAMAHWNPPSNCRRGEGGGQRESSCLTVIILS